MKWQTLFSNETGKLFPPPDIFGKVLYWEKVVSKAGLTLIAAHCPLHMAWKDE